MNAPKESFYKTARIALPVEGFEVGEYVALQYRGHSSHIVVDGYLTSQHIFAASKSGQFDGSEPWLFSRVLSEFCL